MPTEVIDFDKCIQSKSLIFVISGLSGVGKDATIILLKKRKLPFHFVVTATSRPPRPNEVNGVDYIFVTPQQFEEMIVKDELIEYALVYNQYKGVPRKQVEEAINLGKDVVMRLDVQGAAKVKSIFPEAILIFLIPANEHEWYQRLNERHTESNESLQLRIQEASKELDCIPWFDYVVTNRQGQLNETADAIQSIIRAEHCRVQRAQ